jgi:hypothetical protein
VARRSDRPESDGGGPLIHGGGHRVSSVRFGHHTLPKPRTYDDHRDHEPPDAAGEDHRSRLLARDEQLHRSKADGAGGRDPDRGRSTREAEGFTSS